MNPKSGAAVAFAALAMASLLAAFAPGAAAQQRPLSITKQDGPTVQGPESLKDGGRLKPEVEAAQVIMKFQVEVPLASGCAVPITVSYSLEGDEKYPWAHALLSPESETRTISDVGQAPVTGASAKVVKDFVVTLAVTLDRSAPAMTEGTYTVVANAKGGATTEACTVSDAATPAKVGVQIKNDYVARMVYEPSSYVMKAGQNQRVVLPLTMRNLGNGATRVTTTVEPASKARLETIIPPADQIILSKSQAPTNVDEVQTFITVQTPHGNGYTNSFFTFLARFRGVYDNSAATGTTTDEKTLTLTIQVQGVYVPGFDPVGALGALGVAVFLVGFARRRPAEE